VIHPHHSVNHFIDQLDSGDVPRPGKVQMPDWLQAFVWQATEHFDPIGGTARAGYVAALEGGRWVVRLFLGETEIVGGPRDGAVMPTAFTFDLESIRRSFESISRLEWQGLPSGSVPQQLRDDATIAIDGTVAGHDIRLLISLRAPADMGPALRQQPDGTRLLA
jgi:hypothetical protein